MRGFRAIAAVAATIMGMYLHTSPAGAQASPPSPPGTEAAAASCAMLAAQDFSTLPDAPTHISAAKLAPATDKVGPTCQVQGYVAPNVGFELWLPASGWNGKFSKIGCGGFCGINYAAMACPAMVNRGYACITGNMGHQSTMLDAKWAYNNLQAEVDFGYRATHVETLAGKAITAAFYGRMPERSYHIGCSTGGRQGMMEAQRFPWDYDGIVVGAPPINETGDGMNLLWNVVATLGPDGRAIIGPDHIRTLHQAAVSACDKDDGVTDGVISNPPTCGFDPGNLVCKPGETGPSCLTPEQVSAVRKIYGGPVNSKGERVYPARAMPGSELNWINNYVSADGGPSVYNKFIGDMMRYMNFMPDPGPTWKPADFDWDRDYKRLDMMEVLYSASNPDLRRFKAAGGKLIIWQGWADQSVLPENIIDYYQTMERTMGGPKPTRDFARLFMVPGQNHCFGGAGAHFVDFVTYLENWVEKGQAPDVMIAYKPKVMGAFYGPTAPAKGEYEFSRPLYPYPLQAKYKGRGDVNEAESFGPK